MLAPILRLLTVTKRRCSIYLRKFAGDFDERFMRQNFFFRGALDAALRSFDIVFFETQYLVNWGNRRRWHCSWWPNSRRCPDVYISVTEQPESASVAKRLVFVGRVCSAKGVFQLHEFLEIENTIDIWGPIEARERKTIFSYLGQFSGRLRYRGILARQHVYATLACYDALLFPSAWASEGYPGVIIEAAMVGVPSVVAISRGPAELISVLGTGTILAKGERLSTTGIQVLDADAKRSLSQRTRHYLRSERIYENVLDEMLGHDP
jgi:glycosyltransferase involved in cell wall biosynthesis